MKVSRIIFCICTAVFLFFNLDMAAAIDGYVIESYAETYSPGEKLDGVLTVQIKAKPAEDGYVYLVKSSGKMAPKGNLADAQNTTGGIETFKSGDLEFFRVKASNPEAQVSFRASFDCPDFYGAKQIVGDTGAPSIPVTSRFTNPFNTAIGTYSVKVILPAGKEIIAVTTPNAYAGFTLGREVNGSRSVSVSKKNLAATAAQNLIFSYGTTIANSTLGVILLWLFCLAIGIAVLIARFPKKAKAESAA